jgi:membrane fusion protein (multidrug efflux system)
MKISPLVRQSLWMALVGIIAMLAALPASAQTVPVIVKQAAIDRFVDRVEALGTLRANETIELTATVSEIVTDVHFEDGQRVKAGSILVEMTNEEEHALIEEERSTVAEAVKAI